MKYLCSITLIFALSAGPAFGQFYQYTDKNGNVVITDSPPPGAGAREKRIDGERVYRSTRPERDYPASEKKGRPGREEQQKKNYNRLTVAMYMAEW